MDLVLDANVLFSALIRQDKTFNLILHEDLTLYLDEAEKISPDPKDVAYLALALRKKIPVWSNDKALKEKQESVRIFTTKEIIDLLNI